jgi:hypothetical protein
MTSLPEPQQINFELLHATHAQIEKDLKADVEIDPTSEKPAYDQLFEPVLAIVKYLLERDTAQLPQALYRIDLNEQMVNRFLLSDSPAELLADAIIRRCFQKVVLRRLYQNGAK